MLSAQAIGRASLAVSTNQMRCTPELVQQASAAPCTAGVSYGCALDQRHNGKVEVLWVSSGCRGAFRCGPAPLPVVQCGLSGMERRWPKARFQCACIWPVAKRAGSPHVLPPGRLLRNTPLDLPARVSPHCEACASLPVALLALAVLAAACALLLFTTLRHRCLKRGHTPGAGTHISGIHT